MLTITAAHCSVRALADRHTHMGLLALPPTVWLLAGVSSNHAHCPLPSPLDGLPCAPIRLILRLFSVQCQGLVWRVFNQCQYFWITSCAPVARLISSIQITIVGQMTISANRFCSSARLLHRLATCISLLCGVLCAVWMLCCAASVCTLPLR